MGQEVNFLWITKNTLVKSSTQLTSQWGITFFPVMGNTQNKLGTINLAKSIPGDTNIMINYHALLSDEVMKALMAIKFAAIVMDETHQLKGGANVSGPTKIWKNAKILARHQIEVNGAYPIFMTGTPINNKMGDMWAYLNIFDPDRFKSLRDFEATFGSLTHVEGLGLTPQRLLKVLAPNMLRRTKREVASQLPAKNYLDPEMIDLAESNPELAKIHEMVKDDLMLVLDSMPPGEELTINNPLQEFHYLRAILVAPGTLQYHIQPLLEDGSRGPKIQRHFEFPEPYPKLELLVDNVFERYMEGESSVVFSASFNAPLSYLYKRLKEMELPVGMIKGGSDAAAEEAKFQQGKTKILLCNLKAAAEGLNLHKCDQWPGGASHVDFLDRWFNPQLNIQGEDRTHRINTTEPVFIHKYYVEKSIDLYIDAIEKRKISEAEMVTESQRIRVGDWRNELMSFLGRGEK